MCADLMPGLAWALGDQARGKREGYHKENALLSFVLFPIWRTILTATVVNLPCIEKYY